VGGVVGLAAFLGFAFLKPWILRNRMLRNERQARIERWMASHAVVGGIVTAVIVGSLTSHIFFDGGPWSSQVSEGLMGAALGAIPWWIARKRAKAG